jgi:formylglycine-generating enzyme required for sulfatase activity
MMYSNTTRRIVLMIHDVRLKWLIAILVLALPAAAAQASPVIIETVAVGDLENAGELSGKGAGGYGLDRICGAVNYAYNIGKYEVTNIQYAKFLNAVAEADPNGLYNTEMASGWSDIGGIIRYNSEGSYAYKVRINRGNRPVNYVSWYDTLRFANWLHNGQLTGAQGPRTTEDGAYDMSLGSSVVRKSGALYFLPSEDEWYKAAYYKGGGTDAGYWEYPTQSDLSPSPQLPPGWDMDRGSANYYYVDEQYHTTEVGAYNAKPSDSAYGTFDQGGNLFEWNETLGDLYRGYRGGAFYTPESALHASYRGNGADPTMESYVFGFRVASSAAVIPEPASILVWLGLGVVGLIWWRRRK